MRTVPPEESIFEQDMIEVPQCAELSYVVVILIHPASHAISRTEQRSVKRTKSTANCKLPHNHDSSVAVVALTHDALDHP